MFLLVKCGDELAFFNAHNATLSILKIDIIAVYLSPVCVSLLDYDQENQNHSSAGYSFYKLLPVDSSNNFSPNPLLITGLVNQTNKYEVDLMNVCKAILFEQLIFNI